ncbi:hypothetical protein IMZ11_20405 [Microtetraspora sp. AC03309]|uniref:DUF7064 domain-containing protein n=1 Tax=Microtetraspora sp. AC03309 TaxID=2779376 RepID=UPI001E49BD13|nr:hypothetical protein [Microtetraspora sp. AC03309]MCC5577993.1 hypothetical protein [Microtetraspora sp. AC03309]
MRPVPLDEYPIHQSPLSMAQVAATDRNFYDRCYFNAHDRSGEVFLVTGLGVYPNLGVTDAFATVRRGDEQWAVRFSDALDDRGLDARVGGYRVEVVEPLRKIRVVCEPADRSVCFDLTWEGAFPAVLEDRHILMAGPKAILDATRFAQVGGWSGTLSVDGEDLRVDPEVWVGSRDRSWGIRPVGDADPAGRTADDPLAGHWWLYVPLRFDDFGLLVIVQESADGTRTLNHATRVFADGRVEQLGWPRVSITYAGGTRHPESARLHLTTPAGAPLLVEIETLTSIALSVGAGYGGDPDWTHGQWKGRDWSSSSKYRLDDATILARLPFATVDHVARATCEGAVGWGMFEHASMGRHDPSGFADWFATAP